MKKTICILVGMVGLAALPTPSAGQAEQEGRPGQSAPAVVSLPSEMKRVVLIRLKYNTDLLEGIEQAVKTEKIKNAVILSGVGSVTSYHVHAVANTTLPAKLAYTQRAGAMDLIAVNGYVLGGRIHAHITMTDDQKAFGGHLHQGTTVFTFAIITLGVLDDNIDLSRFDDSTWH
jgi:predicted DNA-binding protein with PD1-like motif